MSIAIPDWLSHNFSTNFNTCVFLQLLPHFSSGVATIQILKYLCTFSAEGTSRYTTKLLNLWLLPYFLPRIATTQILKYLCTFSAEGNSRYTIQLLNLWLLPHFSPGIATIQILKYLCTFSAKGNSRYTLKLLKQNTIPDWLNLANLQLYLRPWLSSQLTGLGFGSQHRPCVKCWATSHFTLPRSTQP